MLDLGGIHCKIDMIGGKHLEDFNLIYILKEKVFYVLN